MRGAMLILPLVLLAGCKEQPDFDARYDKAAQDIAARAKAMDADIAESEAAAKAAATVGNTDGERAGPGGPISRVDAAPLPATANPTNPPPSSGE